jgi:hypothetical protein
MPLGLSAENLLRPLVNPSDMPLIDLTQYEQIDPEGAADVPGSSASWGALLQAAGYTTGAGAFRLLVPAHGGPTELTFHVVQDEQKMSVFVADEEGLIAEITSPVPQVYPPRTAAGRRRRALARRALFLLGLVRTGGAALFKAFDGVSAMARRAGADHGIRPHLRRGHYRRNPKGRPAILIPPVIVNVKKLLERMLANEAVAGSLYVLVPDEDLRRDLVDHRRSSVGRSRDIAQDVVTRLVVAFNLPFAVNRCAYARMEWALTTVLAEQAALHNKRRDWIATFDEAFRLLAPVMLKLGGTPWSRPATTARGRDASRVCPRSQIDGPARRGQIAFEPSAVEIEPFSTT